MSKIPSIPTILTFLVIIVGSFWAYNSNAEDSYFYTELSMGHWFDGSYAGKEPDGKLPVTFAFGHAWEKENKEFSIETRHRSNLDLGWPVGPAGEDEYSRNGVFGKLRIKY